MGQGCLPLALELACNRCDPRNQLRTACLAIEHGADMHRCPSCCGSCEPIACGGRRWSGAPSPTCAAFTARGWLRYLDPGSAGLSQTLDAAVLSFIGWRIIHSELPPEMPVPHRIHRPALLKEPP